MLYVLNTLFNNFEPAELLRFTQPIIFDFYDEPSSRIRLCATEWPDNFLGILYPESHRSFKGMSDSTSIKSRR